MMMDDEGTQFLKNGGPQEIRWSEIKTRHQ